MIVGVNEKLDRLMREYRDGDSRTDFNDVMDCVMESVACGGAGGGGSEVEDATRAESPVSCVQSPRR